MNLRIFVMFCDEQSRVAAVIAFDEAEAFQELSKVETSADEDDSLDLEDVIAHVRKYWTVLSDATIDRSMAVCSVAWDRSEGFNINLSGQERSL